MQLVNTTIVDGRVARPGRVMTRRWSGDVVGCMVRNLDESWRVYWSIK